MFHSSSTGAHGEQLAREFLERQGLHFRAANVRCGFGEIDLVMEDRTTHTLVIVEVKARRTRKFGFPEEAVTFRKRRKLSQLINWYSDHIYWKGAVRLDVVSVLYDHDVPRIEHFPSIGVES